MILYGDYHTHTKYTHGTSTLEENVQIAVKKGLKEIAICEHGFNHLAHGISRKKLIEIKAEVDRLNKIYPIKILLGIEANIISSNGDIDLTQDEQNLFDLIIVGYHKGFKPKTFKDLFTFCIPNTLNCFKPSKSRIEKNTLSYIKAIENNRINVLAHLNYGGCRVDVEKLAKVAKEHNVFIELNGKRILFTPAEIRTMIKIGVKFIINSDAHNKKSVGENNRGINFVEKYNIPLNLVVNLDKKPIFK